MVASLISTPITRAPPERNCHQGTSWVRPRGSWMEVIDAAWTIECGLLVHWAPGVERLDGLALLCLYLVKALASMDGIVVAHIPPDTGSERTGDASDGGRNSDGVRRSSWEL